MPPLECHVTKEAIRYGSVCEIQGMNRLARSVIGTIRMNVTEVIVSDRSVRQIKVDHAISSLHDRSIELADPLAWS